MNLIGRIPKGKPEYLDPEMEKTLKGSGKFVVTFFGTEEIYGPFDSIEQLQEWAKAKADAAKKPD